MTVVTMPADRRSCYVKGTVFDSPECESRSPWPLVCQIESAAGRIDRALYAMHRAYQAHWPQRNSHGQRLPTRSSEQQMSSDE